VRVIEKTGKTVEEAVELALNELGVPKEEVRIEVLEEPQKGILGFIGARPARVKIEKIEDPVEEALKLLRQIIVNMQLVANFEVKKKNDMVFINLSGEELGIIIGRRGETLNALQYLVNLSVNRKKKKRTKIILDVEGYRRRREETLRKLALKMADKARYRGKNIMLEPMNSMERRIIHTALQKRKDVYTYSEGEEPFRKIIISPKK